MKVLFLPQKDMVSVFTLLDLIRIRPIMYIGEPSPSHLDSFLKGYYFSFSVEQEQLGWLQFADFHDWVTDQLKHKDARRSWAHMIEDQREDKQEALWLFFQLLDQFRGFSPKLLATVTLPTTNCFTDASYNQKRTIRASVESISQSTPHVLIIQEIEPKKEWVELIAKDDQLSIVYSRAWDTKERALEEAEKIFGIAPSQWQSY